MLVRATAESYIQEFKVQNLSQTQTVDNVAKEIQVKLGLGHPVKDMQTACFIWKLREPLRGDDTGNWAVLTSNDMITLADLVISRDSPFLASSGSTRSIHYIFSVPQINGPTNPGLYPPTDPHVLFPKRLYTDAERVEHMYHGVILKNSDGKSVIDEVRSSIASWITGPVTRIVSKVIPLPTITLPGSNTFGGNKRARPMVPGMSRPPSIHGSSVFGGSGASDLPKSVSGSTSSSQFGIMDKKASESERCGMQPSSLAQPKNQSYIQLSPRKILNERHSRMGDGDSQAPFIGLYDDIFVVYEQKRKSYNRQFKSGEKPFDWTFRRLVFLLISHLMMVEATRQPEQMCVDTIREILVKILGVEELVAVTLGCGSRPDMLYIIVKAGSVSIVIEVKAKMAGSCDPVVQSELSYVVNCQCHWNQVAMKATCCTSFLSSIAGPYISIGAAVLTSRPITQHLNGSGYRNSTYAAYLTDVHRLYKLCSALGALRDVLRILNTRYENLAVSKPLLAEPLLVHVSNIEREAHPRFFPWSTSFIYSGNGEFQSPRRIHFRYVCPLTTNPSCVVFKAVIMFKGKSLTAEELSASVVPGLDVGVPVVIKFVRGHGEQIHRFLCNHDYAPPLYSYDRFELAGGYGDLKLVVMGLVDGVKLDGVSPSQQTQLVDIVRSLQINGMVHGDLRADNIMVDNDGRIRVLDFDTARFVLDKVSFNPVTNVLTNKT
uniref:Protein kinase domain-containing protein n=1 Tax=Moniliophthora roreri TaxID=221103 RepID=A0A0W0F4X8_MONRR